MPNNLAGLDGSILFDGVDLTRCSTRAMRAIRGRRIAMIFQEPMSALDPVFTVGHQIGETLRVHTGVGKEEARERTLDMLRRVGIASPERRIDDYPHQLSGGMRQRVMIAASLICGPQLLIADEPTTALDVTVQAQILELLRDLSETSNTALMLITHDLGVVAETCTRMITMYAGEVIEDAAVDDALVRPLHPYTSGLLRSLPHLSPRHGKLPSIPGRVPSIVDMPNGCRFKARCAHAIAGCEKEQELRDAGSGRKVRCWRFNELDLPGALQHARVGADCGHGRSSMSALASDINQDAIVSVRDLQVQFQTSDRRATVKAVDGVDFDVRRGETFGIIGESGSGKTTIGRALVFLLKPSAGAILHNGVDPLALPRRQFQSHRRDYQIIFQDPNAALNPRMTILSSVLEPLELAREGNSADRLRRAREAMDRVGLPQDVGDRYPHQLSGGQKQRVVIARALTLRPKLIVCDEVVAALDMSIRGDVLNLFAELQRDLGLTYVFITHDLAVVSHISERIAVMYLGRFVELGPTEEVSERPLHPYTQALLSAEPRPLPSSMRGHNRIVLQGEIPSPIDPPSGCRFRTRCQYAQSLCAEQTPEWRELTRDHWVACHFADRPNFSSN